jgi:hypothetical protein
VSGSTPFGESAGSLWDLDGDGTYEDINGNGLLTLEDPGLLGFYTDSKVVQENAEASGLNGDSVVDLNGVIILRATAEEKETG